MSLQFCRYKGFKLQVLSFDNQMVNAITSDWHTGNELRMNCEDRDRFTRSIPLDQIECIWEFENSSDYGTLRILYGKLEQSPYPIKFDKFDSSFIRNGEYAFHKGDVYKSISGYNNEIVFNLKCNIKNKCLDSFIMEKPGEYYKQVPSSEIDFAFQSLTYCIHQNKEFVVSEQNETGELLIEPYSTELYPEHILMEIGFDVINTKLMKWVNPDDLNKIWTRTEPVHNFSKYRPNEEIIKTDNKA